MHCNTSDNRGKLVVAMGKYLCLIAILMGLKAFALSPCASRINGCSYYSCLNETMKCSSRDYLRSFAIKYCKQFGKTESQYSEKGQRFLRSVGLCLRERVEDEIENLNCKSIKQVAADSHVTCYIDNGFCELSFMDRLRIFETVFKSVVFDKTFHHVATRINSECQKLSSHQ